VSLICRGSPRNGSGCGGRRSFLLEYLSVADNVASLHTDSKIHINALRLTGFCQQLVNFS
jgi:hypothetical protein